LNEEKFVHRDFSHTWIRKVNGSSLLIYFKIESIEIPEINRFNLEVLNKINKMDDVRRHAPLPFPESVHSDTTMRDAINPWFESQLFFYNENPEFNRDTFVKLYCNKKIPEEIKIRDDSFGDWIPNPMGLTNFSFVETNRFFEGFSAFP